MGVNIKDVAKAAGVSASTVSRVINNNQIISSETRERVLKAMHSLDYHPNSIARSFANQSTYTIALLIDLDSSDAFTNPFFYEALHGIETVVYREGYYLIIANEKTMINNNRALDSLVFEKRVDGIIIPSSIVKNSVVKRLKDEKFPFVVMGEPSSCREEVDWVDINNVQGGRQAVMHLLENSYRRIAYIGGSGDEDFNRNRIKGYRKALEERGIEIEPAYIKKGEVSREGGYKMMNELLQLPDCPDSIICSHNFISFGAMKAISEKGLKIPDDIGIVSFDNYPIAEFTEPQLTTIDIDVFDLGVQAATILMKLMKMPSSRQQQSLISTKVVKRGSSVRRGG